MIDTRKNILSRPEVLSPAGDSERLEAAIMYGADAVYIGGQSFGMRTSSGNFNFEEMQKAVDFAHRKGVKIYLTCNTLPRNNEIAVLPDFISQSAECGIDAFIVSDVGTFAEIKRLAPDIDVHVSTQAGIVNYLTANTFYNMGAKRVVLARELTLEEIAEIRAKTPADLEIETFVHGSMCVSFSGRCLLSNYLTGRDSNRGDCAQPCRWKYRLVEEKRPNEYYPIFEDDDGAHILNACDLSMLQHIPKLIKAGVTSFKIEGRAKSSYYTAVVTNMYRSAVDEYLQSPSDSFKPSEWIVDELEKVSHRKYSTGFYFGRPENSQVYENGGYERSWEVAAVVLSSDGERVYATQRNKFYNGDSLNVLIPGKEPFTVTVCDLTDENGESIDNACHPMMKLSFKCSRDIPYGAILRRPSSNF